MVEALITPALISWALERSHETADSAAKKINVKPDILSAWERGIAHPTFNQAQNLARKLNVPFGYLYLSTPPTEDLPLPDLRVVAGAPPHKPSPNFLDVLYDTLRKQQWYHEYLQDENTAAVPFIGRFNLNNSPNVTAVDIRNTLGIDDELRQKSKTWELFLTEFINKAEESRILVLRSGIVGSNTHRQLDVEEFRGFAISDELAPLVFINSRDAKAAQIFTLAHELAHLWIGESGISNPDYMQRSDQQRNAIDRYCDSVAAEVLVPSDDFLLRWSDFNNLDKNLESLAAHYRVSALVVLRRAYEFDKIRTAAYRDKYNELLRKKFKSKGAKASGNFYTSLLSRNGSTLTTALIMATAEGRVPPREAASLLNVRLATLHGIEGYLLRGGEKNNA
jgi:Zn-dependent peptidase ImmA (M78 family)/DNA-binding XRE family transcriptional regulator